MEVENTEKTMPLGEPLDRLASAHTFRAYHHHALWEAERHFTWVASVVLSATVIVGTSDKFGVTFRLIGAALLGSVGAVVCLIALTVVKRERAGFALAARVFLIEYNNCFPHDVRIIYPVHPAPSLFAAVRRVISGEMSVREAFQLLFVVLYCLFAAVITFLVYSLAS